MSSVRDCHHLGSIDIKSAVQIFNGGNLKMSCLKIQVSGHIKDGVDILETVSHLGQVLRACQQDLCSVAYKIVRAFIYTIQGEESFIKFFLLFKESATIEKVFEILGTEKDHITVT